MLKAQTIKQVREPSRSPKQNGSLMYRWWCKKQLGVRPSTGEERKKKTRRSRYLFINQFLFLMLPIFPYAPSMCLFCCCCWVGRGQRLPVNLYRPLPRVTKVRMFKRYNLPRHSYQNKVGNSVLGRQLPEWLHVQPEDQTIYNSYLDSSTSQPDVYQTLCSVAGQTQHRKQYLSPRTSQCGKSTELAHFVQIPMLSLSPYPLTFQD